MGKNNICILSNDVETTSIWFNTLSDKTGLKVIKEGMPLLLDIYSLYGIKSTFFVVGDMVEKWPELIRMICNAGHEVASHGWSHEVNQAYDILSLKEQIRQLTRCKSLMEDISGQEVLSFRAPALRVNKYTPVALAETGFKYDSSVAPQRFDMFMSFGSLKKIKWMIAPRKPYRTDSNSLFKRGEGSIIEIPLSAFIMPYTSTTLRIFPSITTLLRQIISLESTLFAKPVVFDIHPNELIDESDQVRKVARRAKYLMGYLLSDLARSHLKARNLGNKCLDLYKREITFYIKKNYNFCTVRELGEELNFLK